MPTPQEIEAYLRQFGQGATAAGQNAINQHVDQPVEAKLAALQQTANPATLPSIPTPPSGPSIPDQPLAAPNAASMTPQDAQNRMYAQIQAPQQMAQASAKLQAQAQLDQAAEEHANHIGEDMSGYSDYKPSTPQPRQFPQIQAKMKTGQPVTSQDIRTAMKGPQEVTPEMEKQLGYGDQDEDEDDNNKASTAEGSYSGS